MTTTATSPTTGRTGDATPTPRSLFHEAVQRDLADFTAAAARTPLDDRWTWGRLQVRWRVFTELFRHLRGDHGHGGADPLLGSCLDGFRRLTATGDHDARAALVVRLTAVREAVRRDLADEESQPQPWDAAAWSALDSRAATAQGLTRRAARTLLPWALAGLDDDQARQLLGSAPRAVALDWRLRHRGFAREQRRDFRHAR